MVDIYRVIDVEDRRTMASPHWQVLMEREDGWRHAHIFPDHIFEARAGEYGIPADDIETLLDVVLHEIHIPEPTKPQNHAADAAALKGLVTRNPSGGTEPIWLYNAPSTEHARRAHLTRIQHVKTNLRRVDTGPGDPLDAIRNAYKPSPEAVQAMTEYVDRTRTAHMQRRRLAAARTAPPMVANHPLAEFLQARTSL